MAGTLYLPRDALPCFPARITVLLLAVCGTNKARPAWISSSHNAVVQDCVRFYLCSPPGEMSLIKHSEQCWQSCLYWKEPVTLASWHRAGELSSVQGRWAALCWPESLPFLGVVVWEECGCTGGKPAQGQCLWRWLQLPKHKDLSLLPLSPWTEHTWRGPELLLVVAWHCCWSCSQALGASALCSAPLCISCSHGPPNTNVLLLVQLPLPSSASLGLFWRFLLPANWSLQLPVLRAVPSYPRAP